jgi:hypothetical protein
MYATKAPFVVVANTCRDVKDRREGAVADLAVFGLLPRQAALVVDRVLLSTASWRLFILGFR